MSKTMVVPGIANDIVYKISLVGDKAAIVMGFACRITDDGMLVIQNSDFGDVAAFLKGQWLGYTTTIHPDAPFVREERDYDLWICQQAARANKITQGLAS